MSGKAVKSKGSLGKRLMRILKIAAVMVLVVFGVLWVLQRKLIYPGASMSFPASPPPAADVKRWLSTTDAGEVEAWLIPGAGATAERPGPAVVFLHGNGEIIDQWEQELRWYTRRGITVLIPEYRGYGRSAGSPSEKAIVRDLLVWHENLLGQDFIDADRLIYHGRSLGGGFAAQLAAAHEPAALILGSTFTSLPDAAADLTPLPRWYIRDKLRVEAVLRDYVGPVLIMHGRDDSIIPAAHAERNAAAAKNATLIVYDRTGHNDMPRGHGRWEDVEAFLVANSLLPIAAEETDGQVLTPPPVPDE